MRTTSLLRFSAQLELLTLVVLVVNLVTVHLPVVSSVTGPIHGCAYCFVIIAALGESTTLGRAAWFAAIPGIGGLLAARRLAAHT